MNSFIFPIDLELAFHLSLRLKTCTVHEKIQVFLMQDGQKGDFA